MKFRFPYEKLLKHKKILEELAMREYLDAKGRLDHQMALLDNMYQNVDDSRNLIQEIMVEGGQRGHEIQSIENFICGEKAKIQRQRLVVREHLSNVEQKQEALIEAAQSRKSLGSLKDKRLKEFRKLMKRQEQKRIDDIVVMRFKKEGI